MGLHGEKTAGGDDQIGSPEGLLHELTIVLACRGDQDAHLGQRTKHLLIKAVDRRVALELPGNAAYSDVAEYAAPERVVEVGDQTLLGS